MKQLLFLFVGLVLSMPLFAVDGLAPVETKGFDIESFTSSPENPELLAEQAGMMAPLACMVAIIRCSCGVYKTQYCDGGSHGPDIGAWSDRICREACGDDPTNWDIDF